MRRLSMVGIGGLLLVVHGSGYAQASGAADGRGPRFLIASADTRTHVPVDARQVPNLRRRISVAFNGATLKEALTEISRQGRVPLMFSPDIVPLDTPVHLRAENITVAGALSEMLVDTGVDVLLSADGRAALVRRGAGNSVRQTGIVIGTVTDGKTGVGLSGVEVSVDGHRWRTATAADGRYRISDVTPGSYTLIARRIGYAPERRTVTVTARQEATADVALQPAATRLGDVVVTAQKREERLQDVPLSIAVVTPEEIDRRGLVSAEDYLRGIPGVNQVPNVAGQGIVIRGLESEPEGHNFSAGATVATYFGEVPTTNSAGVTGGSNVDLKLVDIERVEVLRGPQGTAFGNSSLGGAVRTIPVAPKLDRVEGKVAAGYSATSAAGGDNYNGHLVINVPLLKDKLALRGTGYRYGESGFYRNVAGSDPAYQSAAAVWGAEAFAINENDVGASRFTGGRIAALFQASDALQFTLTYLKQKTESDGNPWANSGRYEQTLLGVAPEHVVRGQQGGMLDTDIDVANGVMDYDFGWANLVATYSYIQSGSERALSGTADFPSSQRGPSEHREHVGEIRLATRLDGPWNFVTGLYAEELKDEARFHYLWYGDPATNPLVPGSRLLGDYYDRRNLTQKAAFAEASWEFLPRLTLTGGVRAYSYDRTRGPIRHSGAFFGEGIIAQTATDATGTTFRGNLSHKLTDHALVYAGWAQGFRLGRPQAGLPPGLCDIDGNGILDGTSSVTIESTKRLDSDNVDNYELGTKLTLLEQRLTIAADVYRINWTGLPINQYAPGQAGSTDGSGCGLAYLTNAGDARSEGVELQANFYVTDAFRVDLGGSWVRGRLTEDVPAQGWTAGSRLPGSPEVNANLGLQYALGFEIGGQKPVVRTDAIYVGPFYSALAQSVTGSDAAGDYVKLDASARVAIRDINVDLFVRNLTNADAFTYRAFFGAGGGEFGGFRLRPRTVGLQLSHNF